MTADNLEGMRLGKYRLLRRLGAGGMGEVYLAEHEMLQSQVAVKVLPAELARDQDMVTRFLREARAAASLRHPHIIRIHDVGQEQGINYFSMDYIEGRTLTELIASSGGLPEDQMVEISRQVLSALAVAHAKGIVHRDIKPDNVIIDERGDAVVMDFGIAKAAHGTRLTAVGSFVGTAHYASPEQARGQEVDARSDLYSWGVVMYEMATGRVPFSGQETSAVLYQHVHEPPTPPRQAAPGISPGLSAFILKLLEKDPDRRYPSAEDALADLDRLTGRTHPSRPGTRTTGSHTRSPRQPSARSQARALLKEAQALAEKGGWAAVLVLAEKALGLDPELAQARDLLSQARDEAARDERIHQLTAEAEDLLGEGRFSDAAQVITELAGISRDKEATLAWLEEVQAQALTAAKLEAGLQKGRALEAAGELDAAEELYRTLEEEHGQHPLLRQAHGRLADRRRARRLLARAEEQLQRGELAPARQGFQQALELDPELEAARQGLERLQSLQSRTQRAQDLTDQAARLLEQARATQALELLEEALALVPDFAPARELRPRAQQAADQTPPPPPEEEVSAPPAGEGTRVRPPEPPTPALEGTRVQTPAQAPPPPPPPKAGTSVQSPPPPPPPPPRQEPAAGPTPSPAPAKGGKGLWIAVAVLVLVVGAGAAWWLNRKPAKPTAAPTTTTLAPTTTTAPTTTRATTTSTAAATTTTSPAPTTTLPRVDTRALQAQAQARQGQRLLAAGDLEGAARAFRRALALKPDLPAAIAGIQKVEKARRDKMHRQAAELVARGRDLLAADQLEQARSTFQEALRLDPNAAGAKEGLEAVTRRQQELARAEAERKRRQERQAQAQAALSRGKELLAAGKLKEAQAAFQQALTLDPELEAAREGQEAVRRRQEELARAEAQRKRAEERRRKVQAAIRRGQALLNAGKLKQAEAAFRQALALDPQAEPAKAGLARLAKRRAELARPKPKKPPAPAKPRPRDQQQELRRQARLAFVQGVTDFNAGRYAQAVRQFQRFLAVFPDDANGRKYLAMARRQLRETHTGTLVVGCRPVAEVYLDGRKLGITPLVHRGVAVGRHQVEVRAYGARQSRPVEIKPRTTVKLRFQLTGGKLAVNAVPWAEIYFDGKKLGTTPLAVENLPLGPHRLELRRPGYARVVREVVLKAGEPVRMKIRLTPSP